MDELVKSLLPYCYGVGFVVGLPVRWLSFLWGIIVLLVDETVTGFCAAAAGADTECLSFARSVGSFVAIMTLVASLFGGLYLCLEMIDIAVKKVKKHK